MKFKGTIPYTKNVGFHNNFHKINEMGLHKAYKSENKVHVDGDTAFIAGTSSLGDWYDNITKIPVWGDLRNSRRYKDADKVLKENPNVKKLVAHSLGGAVSLELDKNNPDKYETTTYAAPVFLGLKGGNRYRHSNDVVSSFDFGAKSVGFNMNPLKAHSYSNYE
jgi:pimeloyl-ACP methyl ester carboxylesterase